MGFLDCLKRERDIAIEAMLIDGKNGVQVASRLKGLTSEHQEEKVHSQWWVENSATPSRFTYSVFMKGTALEIRRTEFKFLRIPILENLGPFYQKPFRLPDFWTQRYIY